jgi:hypothetical protein
MVGDKLRFLTRLSTAATLATVVGVLAATVGASPAQALTASSVSTASPTLQDAPNAVSEAIASSIAEKFGHPVVDDSKTIETAQVSALPNGEMQLVSSSLPVRVNQQGKWTPVDASLKTVSGMVVPTATSVPVQFSAGGQGWMAKAQTSTGTWVTESWPYGSLPTPTLSGATATYAEVLPGVDLKLTASVTGMSEVFVIKNARAAKDPRVADLTLAVSGASISKSSGDRTVASAVDGSTLTSSSPVWWDSSKADADAHGPAKGDFAATVKHSVVGKNLSLDTRSVVEGDVTYPVYVDPDWTGGVYNRWFIDRGYPTTSYLNPATRLKLGYASAALSSDGVNHLARMFFSMDTSAVAGKQILAAHFNSTETYSGSCTPMAVELWWVGAGAPGASWNNTSLGWISNMDTQTVAYGRSGCPANAVGFNALQGVQAAAAGSSASLTLGLKATAEADSRSYKEFSPSASLTITYNSIPGTPTATQFTSPSRTCSTDSANPTSLDGTQPITMQATASDLDAGQNLSTQFSVAGVSPTSFTWSQPTPSQAAGPVSATVPANTLTLGGIYKWHAQTSDGVGGVGPVSADCYFRIVTTSPALPTVVKTSAGTATVGQPMTVQFGSVAGDGVRLFAYWWVVGNGATPPAPPVVTPIVPGQALPACGSASGAVRFVCPDAGTSTATNVTVAPVDTASTLWVASYNDAGRVSLAPAGQYGATGLQVSASTDILGVSNSVGHIWDTENITTSATTVPDLNTTTGTAGSTTRQPLGSPLSLIVGDFEGIPTTLLNYTTSSVASMTDRGAIDTKNSFTVSAWLYASSGSSTSISHVAVSEIGANGAAFTLGTGVNGALTFCRTSEVGQVQSCAVGSNLVNGTWTLVTGIWDSVNQSLRVLKDGSIVAAAVASQPVPASDVSSDRWLCVGGSCSLASGSFVTSQPWDGQVFRPAVFPGVVSSTQLSNLYIVLSPNDDPPADESVGAVVNLGCDDLVTRQQIYDFNPNFVNIPWLPTAGTSAAQAIQWNGLACRWINETSSDPIDVTAVSVVDRGTMVQLRAAAAAAGTPVANLGDVAYFQTIGGDGELQIFEGNYWVTLRSPWFEIASDANPLPLNVLANLS